MFQIFNEQHTRFNAISTLIETTLMWLPIFSITDHILQQIY